jgi:aminoglycoside phosphotransferase
MATVDLGFDVANIAIPAQVLVLARGRPVRVVWHNGVGGVTCEYGEGESRRFVKWSPIGSVDLAAEAARLEWAVQFVRVPVVVDTGSDGEGSWLMTLPLPGENAVAKRWVGHPASATRAIGEGLRALHDTLPVGLCPFTWSAAGRVADAHQRAEAGEIDPAEWYEGHRPLDLGGALALVRDIPDVDKLVVCHGDTCAPNTIIDDRGDWSGHVDLGGMGVADRWADLAIATLSATWNYGPGWEQSVLDAYGIEPDPGRTRYYRVLWDLDP